MKLPSRLWLPTLAAAACIAAAWLTLQTTHTIALSAVRPEAAPALPTPQPSSCTAALLKSINPASIILGDSVEASLVISGTCGQRLKPVDLIIVADESFSMTEAKKADPGSGGRPTRTPPVGQRTPPSRGTRDPNDRGPNDEPIFCLPPTDQPPLPRFTRTPIPPPGPRGTPTDPLDRPTRTSTPVPAEAGGERDLLREEKNWIRDFLDQDSIQRDMASDRLRIGFVSFSEKARIKRPLTNQGSQIASAANGMRAADRTFVIEGLRAAVKLFTSNGSREAVGDDNRDRIILLLSDFQFCSRDVRSAAGLTKGMKLVTIGFGDGVNQKNLTNMATEREYALEPRDLKELIKLYDRDLSPANPVQLSSLTVRDELMANMELIPGSVQPPTVTITGQLLEWQLAPPLWPVTFTYQVKPLEAGIHPLSVAASAEWMDSEGFIGTGQFPAVSVEVIAPTETPSPTPTDTSTPTPTDTVTPSPTPTFTVTPTRTPGKKYLPILYRLWPEPTPAPTRCVPEQQTIDVALVIDTSQSMRDPTQAGGQRKIDAAVEAAVEIVNLMKPLDQATIIGFNSIGFVASPLSGDKAALIAALRDLPNRQAAGTQIDQGILTATGELSSGRHRIANTQSMIVVTDGEQSTGGPQPVRDAAQAAKAAGIRIVTVGLGSSVDARLLTDVASSPSLYFPAPDSADLLRIYREVALLIPCP